MDDNDLRDCFAMFAMMGIVNRGINEGIVSKVAENAYVMADAMMEARKPQEETGIVKARRKKSVG
jgi:hypothetical protein